MARPKGRPMKYAHFIKILEDNVIYTPATIVRYGVSMGFFEKGLKGPALKAAKLKVRHTLARLSANRDFPKGGDGWTVIPGQAPLRGWYGRRWKAALRKSPSANRLPESCSKGSV